MYTTLFQRFRLHLMALILLTTAACATNPEGYVPSEVEQRLTGNVYVGEWKPGYIYKITFKGVGVEMTAKVFVIDSDASRTEYNMPARVAVQGNNVELRFTKFDRVDKLVYDPSKDRLDGYTISKGKRTNFLMAKRV